MLNPCEGGFAKTQNWHPICKNIWLLPVVPRCDLQMEWGDILIVHWNSVLLGQHICVPSHQLLEQ